MTRYGKFCIKCGIDMEEIFTLWEQGFRHRYGPEYGIMQGHDKHCGGDFVVIDSCSKKA